MERSLGRRDVLRLAAGSAGAALLAACGGGGGATNTPSSGATKPAQATLAGGQTPAPSGTLSGGTGGQTPAPVSTSAPAATSATGSAAAGTKPAASVASGTTPLSTPNPAIKGAVKYWQQTYDDLNVPSAKFHDDFLASIKTTLPNVNVTEEQVAYADILGKLRTVIRANQAPDMAEIQLTWAPELAATGALLELNLADFGYRPEQFWPGALRGSLWQGKLYGIPKRNETMAFIYNKDIFQKAGLDPTRGPDTWEDVKNFSKQIKEKTGKPGFGMVAKLNNGNTPYRYMPMAWAYGGAALDETDDAPKYEKSNFDSDGNIQALQWIQEVYTNGWAPQSSLTNSQTEIYDLFISGEVAMMIDKPSAYPIIRNKAPDVAEKMAYSLYPKGPVRRAVVFNGWNCVIFKGAKDVDAAKAVVREMTSPLWSLRLSYESSNPGNRDAFALPEQQQRVKEIKFLDIATEMMQYGISFPAIPEAGDIMNLMVPQMMQDVMLKTKTPEQSAKDTAKKVNDLIAKRK
ncbi:MAG: extracellular solute-binding protein [Chloroflexota bacterium]|nr:extracellular solute-binding protein [Chloroflexota bacterium]MDQ6905247.1 extracellular solute-binding protein [Chloroflexota bacterium]